MRGAGDSLWGLVHDLLALGQDQLDVAWVAHVWVDLGISLVSQDRVEQGEEKTHTTVSTVCAATLLWCLVDLNVLDNQVGGIQTLGVGVGLGVLKKRGQELSRLDGPASLAHTKCLACCIVSVCLSAFRAYVCLHLCIPALTATSPVDGLRTLGSTASAPSISPHGHRLGLVLDVVEIGEGALQLPSVDGLRGLAGVLERHTQVGTASAGALGGLDLGGGVTDHVVVGVGGWVGGRGGWSLGVQQQSRDGSSRNLKVFVPRLSELCPLDSSWTSSSGLFRRELPFKISCKPSFTTQQPHHSTAQFDNMAFTPGGRGGRGGGDRGRGGGRGGFGGDRGGRGGSRGIPLAFLSFGQTRKMC